jgi:hypothetical protein
VTKDRPSGIIILSILALLGAILAAVMAVELLHPLLSVSENLFSLLDLVSVIIFLSLTAAFAWIAYTFLTIDLSDWYSAVGISLLNLALLIISGLALVLSSAMLVCGVSEYIAASAIIVNSCIIVYCLLLNKRRAFGSS